MFNNNNENLKNNDIHLYKQLINIQMQLRFLETKTKKNIERCNLLSNKLNDFSHFRESRDCVLQKSISSTFSFNSI